MQARRQTAVLPRTFGTFADEFIETMMPQWRNEKHRWQWKATLRDHAAALAPKPLDGITTDDVLAVLRPIWSKIPETASRLRGRIEKVLNAAKAAGLREGENPARWRGHLDLRLPRRQRLTRGHHAALPCKDMPASMADLTRRDSTSARALAFCILTAARTGEVLGATWPEIDLEAGVWTVPAKRMKAGEEHRVPLSKAAITLLTAMRRFRSKPYVFPGQRQGEPLSNMAMLALLARMKRDTITVHRFRSTFRDWAGELTDFPRELAEQALAHTTSTRSRPPTGAATRSRSAAS